MIFPINYEQEQQTVPNDNSTFSINQHLDEQIINQKLQQKTKKKQKIVLAPIKIPMQNSPRRSEKARRRWRLLQTMFVSIRQFRSTIVSNIDSPEKLQFELSNFSLSPMKISTNNGESPQKQQDWQQSFVQAHQMIDYFVRLSEHGSKQCLEEMKLILNRYPKRNLYCPSDPNHLINALNRYGQNALYQSCKHGNLNVIKLLLKYGANPMIESNISNQKKEDPLSVCVRWGHIECVEYLIENVSYSSQHLQQLRTLTNNAQIKQLLGQTQSSWLCC